jgi:alpha-N-arabinofuranosidase
MVLLAMRPYGGYFYNLGRETFLAPVRWEDGWPIVGPGSGRVERTYSAPDLPEQRWPSAPACDHFDTPSLAPCWNFLRTPRDPFWSLSERPGFLRLRLRPERLSDLANPSFVGRRQQHMGFAARTAVEFAPQDANECAGLALVQNNQFHFRFVVTKGAETVIRLIKREQGRETLLAERPVGAERVFLKVEARGQGYSFYVATMPEVWQPIAEAVDGRILSTPVAGGFVGAYIGLYASSDGQPGAQNADFDWFEYVGFDEEQVAV